MYSFADRFDSVSLPNLFLCILHKLGPGVTASPHLPSSQNQHQVVDMFLLI
jgi:hypothetical protein